MTENKQSGIRRMGQERWKYLDMANMSFANGDCVAADGYIKAFLETIKEDSPEAKEVKIEFDRIERERKIRINELNSDTEHLGYLEQRDVRNKVREQIEIDATYSRKTVCWTIALNAGLFNA